jgi:hypothetical protein
VDYYIKSFSFIIIFRSCLIIKASYYELLKILLIDIEIRIVRIKEDKFWNS